MKSRRKTKLFLSLSGILILACGITAAVFLYSDTVKSIINPQKWLDNAVNAEIRTGLEEHLTEWTKAWKSGNAHSLLGPMVFFSPQGSQETNLPDNIIQISDKEFQAELSGQFGDLLEPSSAGTGAGEAGRSLTDLLFPYAETVCILPSRLTAGSAVTFQIRSPDIAAILDGFTEENFSSSAVLYESIETVLKQGNYPEKSRTVDVTVIRSGDTWMLKDSFELADALYGGFLTVSRELTSDACNGILTGFAQTEETEENNE